MIVYEVVTYIVIGGVFMAGMIPIVAGIIHAYRENRRLDEIAKKEAQSQK